MFYIQIHFIEISWKIFIFIYLHGNFYSELTKTYEIIKTKAKTKKQQEKPVKQRIEKKDGFPCALLNCNKYSSQQTLFIGKMKEHKKNVFTINNTQLYSTLHYIQWPTYIHFAYLLSFFFVIHIAFAINLNAFQTVGSV